MKQSEFCPQPFPTAQAPQVPPPQSMSVSAPSFLWSTHKLLTQVELTKSQMLLAQAGLLVQNPPFGTPTQALLVQLCPLMHTTPHPPQLLTSVFVLTSQPSALLLLQSAKPELQDWTAQAPPWQLAVPLGIEQTVPQVPQLLGSLWTFVQTPLHNICPTEQAAVQTPPVQLPLEHCPADTQAEPFGRRGTQAPAVQTEMPGWQTLPQAPQLLLSLCSFVQAPLQNT